MMLTSRGVADVPGEIGGVAAGAPAQAVMIKATRIGPPAVSRREVANLFRIVRTR